MREHIVLQQRATPRVEPKPARGASLQLADARVTAWSPNPDSGWLIVDETCSIHFRDRAHMAEIARGMLAFAEPDAEAEGAAKALRAAFARLQENVRRDREAVLASDCDSGAQCAVRVADALGEVLSQIDDALEAANDSLSYHNTEASDER